MLLRVRFPTNMHSCTIPAWTLSTMSVRARDCHIICVVNHQPVLVAITEVAVTLRRHFS
jgi:hypothetical protein